MTRFRIVLLSFLVIQSYFASCQTYWKIGNEHGDEILLTIEVNREKNTFEAYSRKDALKDLAGIFTYTLAKAAGKLKYPEIVFIEGKAQTKNDTLILNGNFNYFDKQFLFSASIFSNQFNGRYLDNRGNPHPLKGIKVADSKPIRDYASMITAAFALTEKSLVNPAWLKSDEWLDFKRKVNSLKIKISDDYELAATYFWLGKKLPFSPYEINKSRPHNIVKNRKSLAGIREIKANSVFFDGNSLPANQKDMDSLAMIINKRGYHNLIIDFRGNSRLSAAAAFLLINYLSDQPFDAGVFLTRKWYDHNSGIPHVQDYQKLFRSLIGSDFPAGELYNEEGWYVNINPGARAFKGKVFLLTDSKTSKVAELTTYVIKDRKFATIVGQKTAGLTVLAGNLKLNSEYDLIIPECDFYTVEGKNLNRIGIEPDISKSGDDVMKYIFSAL